MNELLDQQPKDAKDIELIEGSRGGVAIAEESTDIDGEVLGAADSLEPIADPLPAAPLDRLVFNDFKLRKIRTEVANAVEREPLKAVSAIELEEDSARRLEADAQKILEMQQRQDRLSKHLAARSHGQYLDLLTAAKQVYPKNELPPHRFGNVREKTTTGDQVRDYPVRYKINYKSEKRDGNRDASKVESLSIHADTLFEVNFECTDGEVGEVREIVLDLPPRRESVVYMAYPLPLAIPTWQRSHKRYDVGREIGGPLGNLIRDTSQTSADRIRFVLGGGGSMEPSVIVEDRRALLPNKKTAYTYNPENGFFSIPGSDAKEDMKMSDAEFIEAIDQLYGLIPE